MANEVDISENDLLRTHPVVLEKLLLDHTTHKNIFGQPTLTPPWERDLVSQMRLR